MNIKIINNWKTFYKYWINAPIPCYLIKFEELIEDPSNILKDLARFMLGIKTVEGTKLEYVIQKAINLDPDQKYYPFSISTKQNNNASIRRCEWMRCYGMSTATLRYGHVGRRP